MADAIPTTNTGAVPNAFSVECWGARACFTDPRAFVDRVSYETMTRTAAKGLMDSIYWHPGMEWQVDRIHVLAAPRYESVMRTELTGKGSARDTLGAIKKVGTTKEGAPIPIPTVDAPGTRMKRNTLLLRDVHYVIDCRFVMTNHPDGHGLTPEKVSHQVSRALSRGGCWRQPYFGCKEFIAAFRLWEGGNPPCPPELLGERRLGMMPYEMDYSKDPSHPTPVWCLPVMVDGRIDFQKARLYR